MSYLSETQDVLTEVLDIARREEKLTGFCLGNTTKVDAHGLFFTPIRNTRLMVAGSLIIYEQHHAREIAEFLDGKVQYLLVDTEKKIGPDNPGQAGLGNIERAIRDVVRQSTILTYKGNDLTVDSIDCLLGQMIHDPVRGMGGKKITILGAGNLGAKLALKLVERGASVTITRRDAAKLVTIVSALNIIKPSNTIAAITGLTDNEEAARGAQILIGMTDGIPVITKKIIDSLPSDAIILDAGKGCLTPDALAAAHERRLTLLRVDIRAGFEGQVTMLLEMERLLQKTIGRREFHGIPIVSGGLLGRENEIVVDNIHQPNAVYGIADGQGDFVRRPTPDQTKTLEKLKASIRSQASSEPARS